jgi:hypothetical protein
MGIDTRKNSDNVKNEYKKTYQEHGQCAPTPGYGPQNGVEQFYG